MSWYFAAFVFLISAIVLSWSSSKILKSMVKVAQYLRWREFVIGFFIVAFATSLPDFLIGFNAIFHNIPEVALGNVIGGNLVDLTLVLAIAVFFSRRGITTQSDMVRKSSFFTTGIAILPLFLIWDGNLERMDGIILIFAFLLYVWWLFSEKSRFSKLYERKDGEPIKGPLGFTFSIVKIALFVTLLLAASQGIIWSAQSFSLSLGVPIALVGLLIVGLGSCLTETSFVIVSARKNENWIVLGEIMGSVIVCATLVLGVIALVHPFQIHDLSIYLAARTFLIIAAAFSMLFIATGKKLTKKEGSFLLFIYVAFLIVEVFIQ